MSDDTYRGAAEADAHPAAAGMTPRSNLVIQLALVVVVGTVLLVAITGFAVSQSTYVNRVGIRLEQPVPFSHQHHVAGLGIECAYCHTEAEDSAFAGLPSASTCMGCHSQIFTNAELLEPIRASFRTGEPIAWERVHDVPDFVYFNHSVHVQAGVTCADCHGDVGTMPLMQKAETLTMQWCLDCHRDPVASGVHEDALVGGVADLTNCTACHR